MFLVNKKVASFTATNYEVNVRYGSEPIEPLPVCFSHK
jgi:hypothetical protein